MPLESSSFLNQSVSHLQHSIHDELSSHCYTTTLPPLPRSSRDMYYRYPRFKLHIHARQPAKIRLRLAVFLLVLANISITHSPLCTRSETPQIGLKAATDLHLAEVASYHFRHTGEFAERVIKHFEDDKRNVHLLVKECRVPPVFVSRLGKDGRRRLLAHLTRDSNGIPFWSTIPRIFIVDLQNGLGNRLRALASAMEFAFLKHRVLVVIWAPDAHIRARLPQLLDRSALSNLILIEQPIPWPINKNHVPVSANGTDRVAPINASQAAASSFTYHDFMQKDHGFQGIASRRIANIPSKHLYVKTAYLIEANDVENKLLNVFLQALTPAPRVMQLVHSIEDQVGGAHILQGMIGVHLRSRPIIDDNHEVDSECEYSLDGAQITDSWRKRSTPKQFIPEMKRIHDDWPEIVKRSSGLTAMPSPTSYPAEIENVTESQEYITPVNVTQMPKFFVCVDSLRTLDTLSENFPQDSLISLPRKCDDRGAECMIYALADLVLLSRTGAMLASGWSSFSEVALRMRVRPSGVHPSSNDGYYVRVSGYDFGRASYWEELKARVMHLSLLNKWSPWHSKHDMTHEKQLRLCTQKHLNNSVK